VVTALLAGGLLAWAPDTLANAYPDEQIGYVVPDCESGAPATVSIDAGTVTNTTTLDLSADGGTAIGDSSGGDDNLATTGGDEGKDKDKDGGRNNDKDNNRRDKNKRDRDDASELASAGNGGLSDASADGGAIAVENVNSGGNVGSAIAVGDTWGGGYDACGNAVGGVFIDGGEVINETIISVSADGGTAIADASGGDGNVASTGGRAGNGGTITSSAGNGGVSNASADGGAVSIGDINSGGNAGNAIGVGDTIAGPVPICCEPPPFKPVPGKPVSVPVPVPAPAPSKTPPGKVVVVTMLPSTGIGTMTNDAGAAILGALAAGMASIAARRRNEGDWMRGVGIKGNKRRGRAAG
jgi:LPXTG-motif cell wall-anchored protein